MDLQKNSPNMCSLDTLWESNIQAPQTIRRRDWSIREYKSHGSELGTDKTSKRTPTYPLEHTPGFPQLPNERNSFIKGLVLGLGYVPGVCYVGKFLDNTPVTCGKRGINLTSLLKNTGGTFGTDSQTPCPNCSFAIHRMSQEVGRWSVTGSKPTEKNGRIIAHHSKPFILTWWEIPVVWSSVDNMGVIPKTSWHALDWLSCITAALDAEPSWKTLVSERGTFRGVGWPVQMIIFANCTARR